MTELITLEMELWRWICFGILLLLCGSMIRSLFVRRPVNEMQCNDKYLVVYTKGAEATQKRFFEFLEKNGWKLERVPPDE